MPDAVARDAGEFLAAIPHFIGFVPSESLVLVGLRETIAHYSLRIDLLLPGQLVGAMARALTRPFVAQSCDQVIIAVISDTAPNTGATNPPFADLVAQLTRIFNRANVPVQDRLWAPRLVAGAPWRRYGRRGTGVVPDPFLSEIAAVMAAKGHTTSPDRAALAARIAPAEGAVLARRLRLMEQRFTESGLPATEKSVALLRTWVGRCAQACPTLGDEDVVALCLALTDSRAHDGAMWFALDERGAAARHLWLELARQAPAPFAADAAVLLVWCDLLHGDGSLMMVALEHALAAHPDHPDATQLLVGLSSGRLHPGTARKALLACLRVPTRPGGGDP